MTTVFVILLSAIPIWLPLVIVAGLIWGILHFRGKKKEKKNDNSQK